MEAFANRPDLVWPTERLSAPMVAAELASAGPPLLLDVRNPREWATKHIAGSMNCSQLVREGMRSANACDPPNESSVLFNKRFATVSSRQRGRCQLDMVNKLLIPVS